MRKAAKRAVGRGGMATIVALGLCLLAASAAQAAGRVHWLDFTMASANLDGSASEALDISGAKLDNSTGEAIDPLTERLYWINAGGNPATFVGISSASLDGSGGAVLQTPGAAFDEPAGLAIDPVRRRIYWANGFPGSIWWASLDRPEAHALNTAGAVVSSPEGVAVDDADGRLYWVNSIGANAISFANLDNSGGGGVLATPNAPINGPRGVAIDPMAQKIYWANSVGRTISFASLTGSGGGKLDTTGATVGTPKGLAIDPFAGLVYWATEAPGEPIGFARLDGSGGGGHIDVFSLSSEFPILRMPPHSTASPTIDGGSMPGAVLSCSQGTWSPDLVESFYYDAAKSFTFQWSRDGADIQGATQNSLTAAAEGDYRCEVTARNAVGSTVASSDPHRVSQTITGSGGGGHPGGLTLKPVATRIRAGAPLAIRIANGGEVELTGSLSGSSKLPVAGAKRTVKLRPRAFDVAGHGSALIQLHLPTPLRLRLAHGHRVSLSLSATFSAAGGARQVVERKVVLAPRAR